MLVSLALAGTVSLLPLALATMRGPAVDEPLLEDAYVKASAPTAQSAFGFAVSIRGDLMVVGARKHSSDGTGVNGNETNTNAPNSGAAYVFARSGATWAQQAFLKASNTGEQDFFGFSVAADGDTVVVGAPYEGSASVGINGDESDDSAPGSGAVYVFVRNGSTWSQQAYIKASNTDLGDNFGWSVDLDGDTLVVGAQFEQSNATGVGGDEDDDSVYESGAVYVFRRTGTTWAQEAYLKAWTVGPDRFGAAVALEGNRLVVGAPHESSAETGTTGTGLDNSAPDAGAVYFFVRTAGVWSQHDYLKASNTQPGYEFGTAVAFSGQTIAVGSPRELGASTGVNGSQANAGMLSGAAYVFTFVEPTGFQQVAYVKGSNVHQGMEFGGTLALENGVLAVGASYEESLAPGVNAPITGTQSGSGAVYVFSAEAPYTTGWKQVAFLKASNQDSMDHFGVVDVSGRTLVVGAQGEDSASSGVNGDPSDNSALASGAAYTFEFTRAASVVRNSGANPASYTSPDVVVGTNWTPSVDLSTTGHTGAVVLGAALPVNSTLGGGQVLLVGGPKLFTLPLAAGPTATWSVPIPLDLGFAGIAFSSQAAHLGGVTPFALSNAVDSLVGY